MDVISYSFDDRANGYGRGEGVASIVLKRLDDAIKAGDPIHAVIRQTHLNQDGKTETITSPSSEAQEKLIRSCYEKCGISPHDVQYFEAHGTGTPTGDPIETRAIASVFKEGRSITNPLIVGSVKANLGHTEPTSGLASIIKVAMALQHGIIPPSMNYENTNKQILLKDWSLKIPTTCEEWSPGRDGIRRASVNNFGYGGANAHVILEEWKPTQSPNDNSYSLAVKSNGSCYEHGHCNGNGHPNGHDYTNGNGHANGNGHSNGNGYTNGNGHANGNGYSHENGYVNGHAHTSSNSSVRSVDGEPSAAELKAKVFILTARDEHACRSMATNLRDYLLSLQLKDDSEESFLNSLAYTLAERRSRFPWSIAVQASSVQQLIATLDSDKVVPKRDTSDRTRVGFVFTGQGAQWHAMGRELLGSYPSFKASIMEADNYLREFGASWSLLEELQRDAESSRVSETSLGMPLCAAVQISLVRLLESWGITPVAVSSHSSGEIAAAYTVGAMSFKAAMASCYSRSEVTSGLTTSEGAMLAVGLGADATEVHLRSIVDGEAKVACINSPSSVTVSGDITAVTELEKRLKEQNIFARRLRVRTAFHSHHMQPLAPSYLKGMRGMGVGDHGQKMKNIIYASPTTGTRITKHFANQ